MRWFIFNNKIKPYRGPLKPRYKLPWIDYLEEEDYKPIEFVEEKSSESSEKKEEVIDEELSEFYTDSDDDVRGIMLDDPKDPLKIAKRFTKELGVPEEEIGGGLTDVAEELLLKRLANANHNENDEDLEYDEDGDEINPQEDRRTADEDEDDEEDEVEEAIKRVSGRFGFDRASPTRRAVHTDDDEYDEDDEEYVDEDDDDDDEVGSVGSLRMTRLQANMNKQLKKDPSDATDRLKKMLLADERFLREDDVDEIWNRMIEEKNQEKDEDKSVNWRDDRDTIHASTTQHSGNERLNHLAIVMNAKRKKMQIADPSSHPISILGSAVIGELLEYSDLSTMKRNFPVFSSQWIMSTDMAKDPIFPPAGQQSRSIRLLPHHLGRHIQILCERQVEIPGEDEWDESRRLIVKSNAQIGPVLVADSWATIATKALSKGGLDAAVRIKDNPEIFNEFDDIDQDIIFDHDDEAALANVFRQDGTLSFRRGSIALEYTVEDKGGNKDDLEFEVEYANIHCRPGLSSNTIVLCGRSKKNGLERSVRLEIDPTIGRDIALTCFYAFQGNRRLVCY